MFIMFVLLVFTMNKPRAACCCKGEIPFCIDGYDAFSGDVYELSERGGVG